MTPTRYALALLPMLIVPVAATAQTPRPAEQQRPAALDAAAIRRQAAELADLRRLLADPDPNVRIMSIQAAIRGGTVVQRQLAIETALASNESALLEIALRGIMAQTQHIIIDLPTEAGAAPTRGGAALTTSLRLPVGEIDQDTGRISGHAVDGCGTNATWSGQIQGTVFAFVAVRNRCSGRMTWESEVGAFVGVVNLAGGSATGDRRAIWRPR